MKLYTRNPICILASASAISFELKEVIYVEHKKLTYSRKLNRHFDIVNKNNLEASKQISKKLGLKFSSIKLKTLNSEIIAESMTLFDSELIIHTNISNVSTIYVNADNYCAFGFTSYKTNLVTKLRLVNIWRKLTKYKSIINIYAFGTQQASNKKVESISDYKMIKLLNFVSVKFRKAILLSCNIDLNKKYLLVLPPDPIYVGSDFTEKFFKEVKLIAEQKNLEVIIKPHRNSDVKKYLRFASQGSNIESLDKIKYLFVEFFFTLKCIKYTVAVPSSSLAFINKSQLKVYVPKDKDLFRRQFLNQTVYLKFCDIEFNKI